MIDPNGELYKKNEATKEMLLEKIKTIEEFETLFSNEINGYSYELPFNVEFLIVSPSDIKNSLDLELNIDNPDNVNIQFSTNIFTIFNAVSNKIEKLELPLKLLNINSKSNKVLIGNLDLLPSHFVLFFPRIISSEQYCSLEPIAFKPRKDNGKCSIASTP